MHFASHPSNDRGRGSCLNVNYHHLTHDLARHRRTMLFDFTRRYRSITITTFSIHDRRFIFCTRPLVLNTTTAKTIDLKTSRTVAGHLFIVHAGDVPLTKRAVDGEVVATFDLIF